MSFKELKSALETEVKSFDEAREAATSGVEVKDGQVSIPAEAYAAVTKHKKNIEELKTLMQADADVKGLREFADQEGDTPAARYAAEAHQAKSVADHLLDSPEFKDMVEHGRSQMSSDIELPFANISAYGTKDVYGALGQNGSPATSNYGFAINRQQLPLVQPLKLNSRVRDLFPQASTNANVLEYFKSTFTTDDNNAATVAERRAANETGAPVGDATDVFGLKPKSNLGFQYVTDQVRLIAHWIPAHRNTLADNSQIRSLIDDDLLYGLALEEDTQLLNGNGTGENILGILNRGIQTYTGLASDQLTDQVRRAMTKVELAFLPSTGLVVHPLDWEKLELQKAFANGNYMVSASVVVGGQKRLWQVPVVSTPAIAEGTFLLGAFGQAAKIYDREKASIRVAEQHADFFVRNAVVFLAEERLGLTTPRPEGLVKGTFTTPVPAALRTFETNPDFQAPAEG